MRGNLYANMLKMFSGSAMSQLSWMLSMMVLTRYYAPEDFALYQMFVTLVGVCTIFSTAKYEMAIIVPRYRWQSMQLLGVCMSLAVIVAIVLQLLVFIGCCFFQIEYPWLYYCLPICILFVSFYNCFYVWYVREKSYSFLSLVLIIYPIVNFAIAMWLYFLEIESSHNLIIALIVARLFEVMMFSVYFSKNNKVDIRLFSLGSLVGCMRQYKDFPKYMILGSVLNDVSYAIPVYCLNFCYGADIAGYYSITMQAMAAPSALVAKSVGDVFRQGVSVLYNKRSGCMDFFQKNMQLLMKISVVIALITFFLGPDLYSLVFGEKWRLSGELARHMLPMVCVSLVASPLSNIYVVAGRQDKYLRVQLLYFLSGIITFSLGWYFSFSYVYTILLYSIVMCIVSIGSLVYGRCLAKLVG